MKIRLLLFILCGAAVLSAAESAVPIPQEDVLPTIDISTSIPDVVAPASVTIQIPDADIARFMVRNVNVRDTRNVHYTAGTVDWQAWEAVLSACAGNSYVRVPFSRKTRVIAEVRTPRSLNQQTILGDNIAFYKSRGYDAVLLVVTPSDTAEKVHDTCVLLQYLGMRIWLAFGGVEDLKASAYPDPAQLKAALGAAAPYAECFVLGWRRTSAHLLLQDAAYMKFLIGAVRLTNPDLPVLGELYYGESFDKENSSTRHALVDNLDPCCAGALVNGLGTSGTDFVNAPKNLKKALSSGADTLAMTVIGERAYYLTRGRRRIGWEAALDAKRRIEDEFLKNGVTATVTMSDDGSDGRYGTVANNNLSETLYNQL